MWRQESAHVLGALLRTHADLADAEDAAQEALLAATEQWPRQGPPQDRRAWLIAVARRRLIDQFRSTSARLDREQREAVRDPVVEVSEIANRKSFQQEMNTRMAVVNTPGIANGAMTLRNAWYGVAPSILAAFSSSQGISRKNALRV